MIHRVVLPKNGVESCQQFNGDVTSSLAMLYDDVRRRTIILVIKLFTIVFLFVVVFVLISASIETPSDNMFYPYPYLPVSTQCHCTLTKLDHHAVT